MLVLKRVPGTIGTSWISVRRSRRMERKGVVLARRSWSKNKPCREKVYSTRSKILRWSEPAENRRVKRSDPRSHNCPAVIERGSWRSRPVAAYSTTSTVLASLIKASGSLSADGKSVTALFLRKVRV